MLPIYLSTNIQNSILNYRGIVLSWYLQKRGLSMNKLFIIDDDRKLCGLLSEYRHPKDLRLKPCMTGGRGLR